MGSGKKRSCYNCAHCGADMDMDMDAFCTHPNLGEKWPYGKALHAGIEHCFKNGKLTLHERHRCTNATAD